MEKKEVEAKPQVQCFNKFSHSMNIVKYYGWYKDAWLLLNSLSKGSKKNLNENEDMFKAVFNRVNEDAIVHGANEKALKFLDNHRVMKTYDLHFVGIYDDKNSITEFYEESMNINLNYNWILVNSLDYYLYDFDKLFSYEYRGELKYGQVLNNCVDAVPGRTEFIFK